MIRSLPVIALLGLGTVTGCKTPTEVVVKLETMGTPPASINVRLHRMTPYNDVPAALPAFVTPFLDGADLILQVAPTSSSTVISLLPSKTGPNDLMVSASAPGWSSDPATALDGTFVENTSKTLSFTLTALPPDMGPPDAAKKRDMAGGGGDMAGGGGDMAMPEVTDGAPQGG